MYNTSLKVNVYSCSDSYDHMICHRSSSTQNSDFYSLVREETRGKGFDTHRLSIATDPTLHTWDHAMQSDHVIFIICLDI